MVRERDRIKTLTTSIFGYKGPLRKIEQTDYMTRIPQTTTPKKGTNWLNLILWVALALLIRWQVIEPRWIPSGSMLPTLQLKDKILVDV